MDLLSIRIRRLEEDSLSLRNESAKYRAERDEFCELLKAADLEIMDRTIEVLETREKCRRLQQALKIHEKNSVSQVAGSTQSSTAVSPPPKRKHEAESGNAAEDKSKKTKYVSAHEPTANDATVSPQNAPDRTLSESPAVPAIAVLQVQEESLSILPPPAVVEVGDNMVLDTEISTEKSPPSIAIVTSTTLPSQPPMVNQASASSSTLIPRQPSLMSITPFVAVKKMKKDSKSEGGWTICRSKVEKYLSSIPAFAINPPPLPVLVSRRALTATYGLPGMGLVWTSKDKRFNFLTPTFAVNPEMPRAPGAPGLLLSCREEMCKNGPWTFFIKDENCKKVRLNYAGEYNCRTVGKLTKEEFAAQDPAVKITWGEKILKTKRHLVYRELHARISLRKTRSAEPTQEDVAAEAELIKQKGYAICITISDVVDAFERGEEHINVVTVQCVAYNHDHAENYAKAQRDWDVAEMAIALAKHNGTNQKPAKRNKKGIQCAATVPAQRHTQDAEERQGSADSSPSEFKELMREEATWQSDESELSDVD